MRAGLFFLVFCFAWNVSQAQNEVLSNIPVRGKDYRQFIPKSHWLLGDVVNGDLNKDGKQDIVLSLRDTLRERLGDEPERLLIILFKEQDGYKVAGKSSNVLLCSTCGGIFGDPFAGVDIRSGVISIDHYGGSAWRWSNTDKFRFQKDGFYLIGTTSDWFWINGDCGEDAEIGHSGRNYEDINLITGDREVIKRTEDCKLIEHTKTKEKTKALIKLEDYRREEE